MRTCDVDGCDNKHHGLGYCEIHYRRVRVHGDVHKVLKVYNRDRKQSSKPHPSGEDHHAWKGDDATDVCKRRRAVRRYELGDCDECGKKATDRHHIDGDTGNNKPDNIASLCRYCHMKIDGRLDVLIKINPKTKPPTKCIVCGKLHKPTRKGKCAACYGYFYRCNEERPEACFVIKVTELKEEMEKSDGVDKR